MSLTLATRFLWALSATCLVGGVSRIAAGWRAITADQPLDLIVLPPLPSESALDSASVFAASAPALGFVSTRPQATHVAVANVQTPRPPEQQPRLHLSLSGVVGPPWAALLQGVPGAPSPTLLKVGDTVAGLYIASAARDSVVIRGLGNTYVLRIGAK